MVGEVQYMLLKLIFQSLLCFLCMSLIVSLIEIGLVVHTIGLHALPLQSLILPAFEKSIPAGCIATFYFIAFLWHKNRRYNQ